MPFYSVFSLLLVLFAARAYAQPQILSADSIVARMSEARTRNRDRLRPFRVFRNYKLFGNDGLGPKTKSEVTADIIFTPPAAQQYRIHKVDGLHMGEVIVRKILESENDVMAHRSANDITKANYVFRFLREDTIRGRPCYVLEIRPVRKDTTLLRGLIWVDANTYLLHRIEGEPAKPPSWWVRDIHIVLDFHEVSGMWLQTALLSTANVRLLGQHTIVSRDVKYEIGDLAASTSISQAND